MSTILAFRRVSDPLTNAYKDVVTILSWISFECKEKRKVIRRARWEQNPPV